MPVTRPLTLSHGFMAQHAQSTTVTISAALTWTDIDSGYTDGAGRGVEFQNSKEMKVIDPGFWLINWNVSLQLASTNNQNMVAGISVNGTIQPLFTAHGKIAAGNDLINVSGVGDLVLAEDDLVRLALINIDTSNDFVVEHAGLTMFKVEDPP